MTSLEVEWKLSIEFDNFTNLDLFQRGCYQVRCRCKGPASLKYAFELATDVQHDPMRDDYLCGARLLANNTIFATSVVNVQYRKEEFSLNEMTTSTLTALTDCSELPKKFTLPHLQLVVDLLFCDNCSQSDVVSDLQVVCTRVVDMHYDSNYNIHHRIPLVFDYFHLASVSFTVHSVVSGIRSTLQSPAVERGWFQNFFSSHSVLPPEPTLPRVLFGDVSHKRKKRRKSSNQAKYEVMYSDMDHAVAVHKALCEVLLSSLDGLVSSFSYVMEIIPHRQRIRIALCDKATRLASVVESVKGLFDPSELIATVENDVNALNAEVNVLWTQYVEAVSLNPSFIRALAAEHDRQLLNRFYEASIVHQWPLELCIKLSPKSKFNHSRIADAIRRSKYIEQAIAPLELTCVEMDGDCTIMPIIFEDRYDANPPIGQKKRVRHLSAPSKCDLSVDRTSSTSSQLRRRSQICDVQHPSLRHRVTPESFDDMILFSQTEQRRRQEQTVNGLIVPEIKANGLAIEEDLLDGTSSSSQITEETRSQEGITLLSGSQPMEHSLSLQSLERHNEVFYPATNGVSDVRCDSKATSVAQSSVAESNTKSNTSVYLNHPELILPGDLSDIDWSSLPPDIVQEILEVATSIRDAEESSCMMDRKALPNEPDYPEDTEPLPPPPLPLPLPPPPPPPPPPPTRRRNWSPTARAKNIEPAKGELREMLAITGCFLSDLPNFSSEHVKISSPVSAGAFFKLNTSTHVIVCVHGLEGNSNDLRSFRIFLEMAMRETRVEFIMSEVNQPNTFADFNDMTDNFIQEVFHHLEAFNIQFDRISFIGHSLGNIIIRCALSRRAFRPLVDRLHTFLSLSGPHLGMLYHTNSIVNTGIWLAQKWKKSESLAQLALRDHSDPRQSFLYQLSQSPGLNHFKNILLVSSVQDQYVPYHSARIEMCKPASKDTSDLGDVYKEMVQNILQPVIANPNISLVRYNVIHHLPSRNADTIIGRAAHIAMLDSELFIKKFVFANCSKYFL